MLFLVHSACLHNARSKDEQNDRLLLNNNKRTLIESIVVADHCDQAVYVVADHCDQAESM